MCVFFISDPFPCPISAFTVSRPKYLIDMWCVCVCV